MKVQNQEILNHTTGNYRYQKYMYHKPSIVSDYNNY